LQIRRPGHPIRGHVPNRNSNLSQRQRLWRRSKRSQVTLPFSRSGLAETNEAPQAGHWPGGEGGSTAGCTNPDSPAAVSGQAIPAHLQQGMTATEEPAGVSVRPRKLSSKRPSGPGARSHQCNKTDPGTRGWNGPSTLESEGHFNPALKGCQALIPAQPKTPQLQPSKAKQQAGTQSKATGQTVQESNPPPWRRHLRRAGPGWQKRGRKAKTCSVPYDVGCGDYYLLPLQGSLLTWSPQGVGIAPPHSDGRPPH